MYNNVGKKIKALVKFIAIFGSILSAVAGFILLLIAEELAVFGLLLIVVVPIATIISSYYAYGFGEIVDTAVYLREGDVAPAPQPQDPATPAPQTVPLSAAATPAPQAQPVKPVEPAIDVTPYLGKKFCSGCGELITDPNVIECPVCGSKYLGVITRTNAANIIPNIVKH